MMNKERESVKVLRECIELQLKKSRDYQNPNSNVLQAMHYRRGVDTIHDILHGKMLRAQSLLESGGVPNFESLEDTYKDMINYASFAVSYLRGKMEGQEPEWSIFNRPEAGYTSALTLEDSFVSNRSAEVTVAAIACGHDPNDDAARNYVDSKLK
jgi:hypothetical protein